LALPSPCEGGNEKEVRECEGEGGRENLRLDGFFPALSLTSAQEFWIFDVAKTT
jgi:hypothetical protein